MYDSIKTLYNVEPPVADEEVRAAALEYVRKIAGFHKPAPANETPVKIDSLQGITINALAGTTNDAPAQAARLHDAETASSRVLAA